MSKRRHEYDSKIDRWRKKIKKYEHKLNNRRVSFEDDRESLSPSPSSQRGQMQEALYSSPRASTSREPTPTPSMLATHSRHTTASTVVRVPLGIQQAEVIHTDPHPGDPLPPAESESPHLAPEYSQRGIPQLGEPLEVDSVIADPELLQALGTFETETAEWGRDILDDLAKRWDPILRDGLKKEVREDIMKKYLLPKNCPLMKAPVLNPEMSTMLNESAKNRDTRLIKKQAQLGCAFSILGRTMSDIITKSIETSEILRNLSDMAKLLADSHYSETETRRSLVTPMVDKTFIEPFKDRKRDSHLFGDKLGDFIKSSRGIQKTGKLIQPNTSCTTRNLNSKGPASQYQQQRSSRLGNRAGETRAYPYRRRPPLQPTQNNRAPPAHIAPRAVAAAPPYRKQVAASSNKRKP